MSFENIVYIVTMLFRRILRSTVPTSRFIIRNSQTLRKRFFESRKAVEDRLISPPTNVKKFTLFVNKTLHVMIEAVGGVVEMKNKGTTYQLTNSPPPTPSPSSKQSIPRERLDRLASDFIRVINISKSASNAVSQRLDSKELPGSNGGKSFPLVSPTLLTMAPSTMELLSHPDLLIAFQLVQYLNLLKTFQLKFASLPSGTRRRIVTQVLHDVTARPPHLLSLALSLLAELDFKWIDDVMSTDSGSVDRGVDVGAAIMTWLDRCSRSVPAAGRSEETLLDQRAAAKTLRALGRIGFTVTDGDQRSRVVMERVLAAAFGGSNLRDLSEAVGGCARCNVTITASMQKKVLAQVRQSLLDFIGTEKGWLGEDSRRSLESLSVTNILKVLLCEHTVPPSSSSSSSSTTANTAASLTSSPIISSPIRTIPRRASNSETATNISLLLWALPSIVSQKSAPYVTSDEFHSACLGAVALSMPHMEEETLSMLMMGLARLQISWYSNPLLRAVGEESLLRVLPSMKASRDLNMTLTGLSYQTRGLESLSLPLRMSIASAVSRIFTSSTATTTVTASSTVIHSSEHLRDAHHVLIALNRLGYASDPAFAAQTATSRLDVAAAEALAMKSLRGHVMGNDRE